MTKVRPWRSRSGRWRGLDVVDQLQRERR